jgi:hypothetical protein
MQNDYIFAFKNDHIFTLLLLRMILFHFSDIKNDYIFMYSRMIIFLPFCH